MRLPHWLHDEVLTTEGGASGGGAWVLVCRACGRRRPAAMWPWWRRVPLHVALGVRYRYPPCCVAFFVWTAEVRRQAPAARYGVTPRGHVPCPLHRRLLRRRQPRASAATPSRTA